MKSQLRPYLVGAAVGAVLALLLGWQLWHVEPVREAPAFERKLPGGATVLARDPDAKPPAEIRQAAKEGRGKLVRAVSVTVKPRPIPNGDGKYAGSMQGAPHLSDAGTSAQDLSLSPQACSCAPVRVDLGLLRMPDRSHRVVATSPDGEVVGGMDIPLDMPAPGREARWAAGGSYAPQRLEFGAFLDRDLGPLRLGVEVQNRREGLTAVVRVGVRF